MNNCISKWRAAGLLALAGLAGCGRSTQTAPEAPAPSVGSGRIAYPLNAPQLAAFTVQVAEPRRLAIEHLTGRLYWNENTTVRIFTPVMGRVTAVRADIGQSVSAGDPLAEISSPDFGQALADARTACANLSAADRTFARTRDLFDHGAAAQKDVEAAEAAYRAALAERDRAESRLKLYGGKESDSGEEYVLRSPIAGLVVDKAINPGQEVRNDQMLANAPDLFAPLFVVADPSVLWLQLDAAESDLALLEAGQGLRVRTRAFPGEVFTGSVENIGDEMDPSTRTVKVRGIVQNPRRQLKAEMYVEVDVVRDETRIAKAGVEISSKAVFTIDNRPYLFVETSPGQFERRGVEVGTEQDGRIPVLTGVLPGEKVVTEGGLLLQSVLEPAD